MSCISKSAKGDKNGIPGFLSSRERRTLSKGQTLCRLIAVFLIFAQAGVLATRSAAQDEARENSDKVLSYEDVAELTSSGALTFPGLGQSKYSDNGVYRFTDEASSITRFGFFDIQKDGKVCVDFFSGPMRPMSHFSAKERFGIPAHRRR